MILLVGECGGDRKVAELEAHGWGRMWVKRRIRLYPGEPWGFDNGAFAAWRAGEAFDGAAYARRLEAARQLPAPLLAVVPDKVGAPDSLAFSVAWRAQLPDDWPWYLALQDGMEPSHVQPFLHRFRGLFLGGTTRFKRTAQVWCRLAHAHGLRFHWARCSSLERLTAAREIGADSADSTQFQWSRALWASLLAHARGDQFTLA